MLLVDAYNVLHVTGILPPEIAGPDALGLAELITASRWGGGAALVVCDGPGPPGDTPSKADRTRPRTREVAGSPGVLVVYVGAGRDADGYIERLLQRESAPRNITVVSSDRRLRHAARQRRARWISSEAFLRQLAADSRSPARGGQRVKERRPPVPLDPPEVARWMKEFGIVQEGAGVAATPPSLSSAREREALGASLQNRAGSASSAFAKREASGLAGGASNGAGEAGGAGLDPILAEAMKEWRGRLYWDDLNMDKWLEPETN